MTDFVKKIFGVEAHALEHLLGWDDWAHGGENIMGGEGLLCGKNVYISRSYVEGHLVMTLTIYEEKQPR